MRKILAQYEGTSGPNARVKKRDEFFMTLKPTTLAKLLEPALDQQESVYNMDSPESVYSVYSTVAANATPSEAGSSMGEGGSLLILDLRSFEEYQKCHIHGARHYDRSQLSKATNNFPREVYFYRGSADSDKMVVLYDEEGKGITQAGNTFVEKGIENTFVLAGGFYGVCSRCPHILSAPAPEAIQAALAAALQRTPSQRGPGSVAGSSVSSRPPPTASSVRSLQSCNSSRAGDMGRPWK